MKQLYKNHPDYKVLGMKDALTHVKDEILEFITEPSYDEFSDIMYGMNRLVGSIFNKKYIGIFPGAGMHINKCNKRFTSYGHFRSKRHI